MISPLVHSLNPIGSFIRAYKDKTMLERLKLGELYDPSDPEIQKIYKNTLDLCQKLNRISPKDQKSKRKVLKELFGYETDAVVQDNFHCELGFNIKLGKNCFFNFNCTMIDDAPIEIGDAILVAPSVTFAAGTHPTSPSIRKAHLEYAKPIKVGNNVWIGANAVIGPGVTIGDNAVIGAGSVVIKDVPANTVVVGNTARVIKHLKEKEDISQYL